VQPPFSKKLKLFAGDTRLLRIFRLTDCENMFYHVNLGNTPFSYSVTCGGTNMLAFAKTVESPCKSCEFIDRDKDECSKDCLRLSAFQAAILRRDEINIKNFQVRNFQMRSLAAGKAV
jgi:hypothetical protein